MKWQILKQGRVYKVQKGKAKFELFLYFFKRLKLKIQSNVSSKELENLLLALLKERVIQFITLRDRSQFEIERYLLRLKQNRFTLKIIAWLKRMGLIDDKRFAQKTINYYKERLYGPFYIKRELRNRRVSEDLIDEMLLSCYTKEQEQRIVEKLADRYLALKGGVNRKNLIKLGRFLKSRGFPSYNFYQIIEKYGDRNF